MIRARSTRLRPTDDVGLMLAVSLLGVAAPAAAKESWAGAYRVAEGPDVAGGLELRADHRFAYFLAAGALDERAQGAWREDGGVVRLTTEPKPRPAVFSPAPPAADAGRGPLRLAVTWPDGRGIAGIDFRIGFDVGEPVEGYTQEYGWEAPEEETRQPRWIELAVAIHSVASPRFDIAPGQRALAFVLTPNDLGVIDLAGAVFRRSGDHFTLAHPHGGELRLRRDRK